MPTGFATERVAVAPAHPSRFTRPANGVRLVFQLLPAETETALPSVPAALAALTLHAMGYSCPCLDR